MLSLCTNYTLLKSVALDSSVLHMMSQFVVPRKCLCATVAVAQTVSEQCDTSHSFSWWRTHIGCRHNANASSPRLCYGVQSSFLHQCFCYLFMLLIVWIVTFWVFNLFYSNASYIVLQHFDSIKQFNNLFRKEKQLLYWNHL